MDIAQEIATSQAVWAILCIAFAVVVFKEMRSENIQNREESKEREDKLMTHLARSNTSQEQTTSALQSINTTLATLEGRVDRIEKHSFKNKGEK